MLLQVPNHQSNEGSHKTLNLNHSFFLYCHVLICKLCLINQWQICITSRTQHFINFLFFTEAFIQEPCIQRQWSLFLFWYWEELGNEVFALGLRKFHNFYLISQRRFWILSMKRKTCYSLLFALKMEKKKWLKLYIHFLLWPSQKEDHCVHIPNTTTHKKNWGGNIGQKSKKQGIKQSIHVIKIW